MIICIGVVILNLNDFFHVGTRDLFSWVYTNLDPINPNRMWAVNGAFPNNPHPMVIAGNLWTLTLEFWCYIFLATTVAFLKSFKFVKVNATSLSYIIFLFAFILQLLGTIQKWEDNYSEFTRFAFHLLPLFLFGGVCSVIFKKFSRISLRVTYSLIVVLFILIPLSFYLGAYNLVGCYLIGVLVVALTSIKWLSAQKILKYFRNHDIAFGIYLYSFPIQQLLWMLGLKNINSNFFVATVISIFAGHISYVKIESRHLKISSV